MISPVTDCLNLQSFSFTSLVADVHLMSLFLPLNGNVKHIQAAVRVANHAALKALNGSRSDGTLIVRPFVDGTMPPPHLPRLTPWFD